jgi:hypothetical protein
MGDGFDALQAGIRRMRQGGSYRKPAQCKTIFIVYVVVFLV